MNNLDIDQILQYISIGSLLIKLVFCMCGDISQLKEGDDQLNKFTLIFRNPEIEVLYQSQSIQRLLKPLYYGLVAVSVILNTLRIIVIYQDLDIVPYINIGFVVTNIISLFIIYKKGSTTSIIMTFENACLLLYQLNFIDGTKGQEYYLYGSNFALIQAVFYFATDFYLSFPSVILHQAFRFSAATLLSNSFDFIGFLFSITTAVFLIGVLYICNKAQRLQFLMNLKEHKIEKQLPYLINKPLAKFRYNEKKLILDVDVLTFEKKFLNQEDNLCEGCNFRKFSRSCTINGKSIEQLLIRNEIIYEKSLEARLNKKKLKIRLNSFNTDNSIILIIESSDDEKTCFKSLPSDMMKQLKQQFRIKPHHKQNLQFRLGVISLLYIGQFQIGTINILKALNQLISSYSLNTKQFKINLGKKSLKLSTYKFQLKIFLIQIFNIISVLKKENCDLEDITIHDQEIYLAMKLSISNQNRFLELYSKNYFINQSQKYILFAPVGKQLIFYFNNLIPFKGFNTST